MNKKLLASLAPFALALPLATAAPASAKPTPTPIITTTAATAPNIITATHTKAQRVTTTSTTTTSTTAPTTTSTTAATFRRATTPTTSTTAPTFRRATARRLITSGPGQFRRQFTRQFTRQFPRRFNGRFLHFSRLNCDINAHTTWRGNIRVSIRVDQWGPTFGGTPLFIRVTDNWRTVRADRVWTWLPYRDSDIVRNLRGPDDFTLTAYNPRTGARCWDTTTVW